jgi:heparosan-N-sulfate-glucuronate 5-epimerase
MSVLDYMRFIKNIRVVFATLLLLPFTYMFTSSVYGMHQAGERWRYTSDGIPIYDYGKYGKQVNPLFVAVEVLHHSRHNTTNDIAIALNNADWLISHAYRNGSNYFLIYHFPPPAYKIKPPWVSAMTQANALAAMAEAHRISHNGKYLEFAKGLMNTLYVDVKSGGATYKSTNDGWWYEEYASMNDTIRPHVLNGFLDALIHIYKYYQYTNDASAKFLFDKGIISLVNNIHKYDVSEPGYEGYSYYDSLGKLPGEFYHRYHVALLSTLLNLTNNNEELKKYHDKWDSYQGPFPKTGLSNQTADSCTRIIALVQCSSNS